MQELVLLLSSIAGACTAAAYKKFPKNTNVLSSLGLNSKIKTQIHSLLIEKDILNKTITRLYQNESGLTKIQRDKLLLRYQHQLGIVLARIEKLEQASKHPDLGPLGDGLVTLMDQKLSNLDKRLIDISSKISVANLQAQESKVIQTKEEKPKQITKPSIVETKVTEKLEEKNFFEKIEQKIKDIPGQKMIQPIQLPPSKIHKPVEITTLTEIPSKPFDFSSIQQKPKQKETIIKEIQTSPQEIQPKVEKVRQSKVSLSAAEIQNLREILPKEITQKALPAPQEKTKPSVNLLDDDNVEDDDDDLEKIKGEILKTLSKLDQAEVE